MPNELQLRVNEKIHTVTASPDTPLLYVLTDETDGALLRLEPESPAAQLK